MIMQEMEQVCRNAIEEYGEDLQELVVIEELSELIKEIIKKRRGKDNLFNIIDETADVYLCLMMLNIINTGEAMPESVTNRIEFKAKRLQDIINNKE